MDVSKILCLFLICIPLVTEAADWDYSDGAKGPANWKNINPKCGGNVQSPIDYNCSEVTYGQSIGKITLEGYGDPAAGSNVTLLNNGHTLQVGLYDRFAHNMSGGGLPGHFTFAQLHFHWGNSNSEGSEHVVDGRAYPLELHFVHYNTKYSNLTEAVPKDDGLAVLGVFFEISSADNAALTPMLNYVNDITEKGNTTIPQFNLRNLMPANLTDFYRNNGSLTTPPCDESVTWTVFKNALNVSEKQLNDFRRLKDAAGNPILKNYRPIQMTNGRKILATFSAPSVCPTPPPTTPGNLTHDHSVTQSLGPTTPATTTPTTHHDHTHSGTQSLGAASFTAVLIAFVIHMLNY